MLPDSEQQSRLAAWIERHTGQTNVRVISELSGGNSNLTMLLRGDNGDMVMRTPPANTISPTAHRGVERESQVMAAMAGHIKVPAVLGWCEDVSVIGRPFLLVERIDGVSISDSLPHAYNDPVQCVNELGRQLTVELAAMHTVEPAAVGLDRLGNPSHFLQRNIDRWLKVRHETAVRPLPLIDELAKWMVAHLPAHPYTSLVHGDFHLDNTLCRADRPELAAIIDWELATLGDPLTDLGLFLMFWGNKRAMDPPGFRHVQAVTRAPGVTDRQTLANMWARETGYAIEELNFYLCFAFWRLAAIVEGAWILQSTGKVDSAYARGLEYDVPALLEEAAAAARGDW